MARWPSGVPVFTASGDLFVATDIGQMVGETWLNGLIYYTDGTIVHASCGLGIVRPLNSDAKAMIAIARSSK